jgi:hypothetical protein
MRGRHLLTAAFALVMGGAGEAAAHSVTVDGDASDWGAYGPRAENFGQLIQIPSVGRQLIWWDQSADERTDFANPDPALDLVELRLTGDQTNLYFVALFTDLQVAGGDGATQIQIGVAGGGSTATTTGFFLGNAETNTAAEAAWVALVRTLFGSGAGLGADTAGGSVAFASGAAIDVANDVIEGAVAWTALGFAGPPDEPLRFTIGVFRTNASNGTFDVPGSEALSDAMDAVTSYGMPGAVMNTFDEVGDGAIDHSIDVWFGASGEPYAPVVINELDYDNPGTDAAEFIELANAAPVDVDLEDWRLQLVEGAAGGASIDAEYTLPAVALASSGYFVVCAEPNNTPNCDLDVAPNAGLIEAGADAVALMLRGIVIDTVSYNGSTGAPYTETSGAGLTDTAEPALGISRHPDGADTHSNAVDLSRRCLTPGAANASASTACTLCGNAVIEEPGGAFDEECDHGLLNGPTGCCTATCNAVGAGTECRAVAPGNDCDVAEVCPGAGALCPPDAFAAADVECRAVAGDCDVAETCTGSDPACPADALDTTTVCRSSAGPCDAAEICDGSGTVCPEDTFVPDGTTCGPEATCVDGACTDDPGTGGGGSNVGGSDAGGSDAGGSAVGGAPAGDGGAAVDASEDGGCACHLFGSRNVGSRGLTLVALTLVLWARRRARRPTRVPQLIR